MRFRIRNMEKTYTEYTANNNKIRKFIFLNMKNNNLGKLARILSGFKVAWIYLLIFCYFLYNYLGGIYLKENELEENFGK